MKSREEIIFDMCMTTDHSFGLVADDPGQLGTLPPAKRRAILDNMSQLYDHHIAPLLVEIEALRANINRNDT